MPTRPVVSLFAALALSAPARGLAAPAEPAPPATGDEVAKLVITTVPADAQVYVFGPEGRGPERPAGSCTGACTLRVLPGGYRVDAGFSHGGLTRAGERFALDGGRSLELGVEVRPNRVRNAILGGALVASLVCIVGYLAVGARDWPDFPEGVPARTPATNALMAGVVGSLGVGLLTVALTDDPVVTTRVRNGPGKGGRP